MNVQFALLPTTSRIRRILLIISAAIMVVTAAIIATLPPARQMIANPTLQAAVLVRDDAFQNHLFDPPVIRVPVGSTVTWTFADRGPQGNGELDEHNAVGTGFAAPLLTNGTWSHTFDQPGTYRYVCTLYAYMDGQIEVVAQ